MYLLHTSIARLPPRFGGYGLHTKVLASLGADKCSALMNQCMPSVRRFPPRLASRLRAHTLPAPSGRSFLSSHTHADSRATLALSAPPNACARHTRARIVSMRVCTELAVASVFSPFLALSAAVRRAPRTVYCVVYVVHCFISSSRGALRLENAHPHLPQRRGKLLPASPRPAVMSPQR